MVFVGKDGPFNIPYENLAVWLFGRCYFRNIPLSSVNYAWPLFVPGVLVQWGDYSGPLKLEDLTFMIITAAQLLQRRDLWECVGVLRYDSASYCFEVMKRGNLGLLPSSSSWLCPHLLCSFP